MKGVLSWLVLWAIRALDVSPVQNIIFLTTHFFTLLVPIAQQPGHAVVLCRLYSCVSGFHSQQGPTPLYSLSDFIFQRGLRPMEKG